MISTIATNPTSAAQLRDQFESVKPDISCTSLLRAEHSQFVLTQLSAGTHLSEHCVSRPISFTVLDGHGTLTVEEREIALEHGVFVYMSANTPHTLCATDNLTFLHT